MALTIGDGSAPSQVTRNYDALLSTTLAKYRPTLIDNIFKDSAFLAFIRMSEAYVSQDGGERIAVPLLYGKNKTVKTYGGYEILDTTPQEGMTTAFYPWAHIGGTISISRDEQRKNADSETRILNLLESKIKQAEMTMREELNQKLLQGTVSGATFIADVSLGGSVGVLPLGYFLRKLKATNPTSTNVGNISSAAEGWWRHRVGDFSGGSPAGADVDLAITTYKGFEAAVRRMYNFCARGSGGAPNLAVGDQISWETYVNALDTKTRFQNTKMADLGFDTIKIRGSTFIWDEVVPDMHTGTTAITEGSIFFLNTEFYKVVYDQETNFITTPFVEPENQAAMTSKLLWMGNATVSNLRKLGVALNIPQDVVS
ncbi:MAG: phage major capsid protein [Deltaproteobacteria bacterium]|nr:phage major capsid protein [Deltaproteobacteria bacterium]